MGDILPLSTNQRFRLSFIAGIRISFWLAFLVSGVDIFDVSLLMYGYMNLFHSACVSLMGPFYYFYIVLVWFVCWDVFHSYFVLYLWDCETSCICQYVVRFVSFVSCQFILLFLLFF